METATPASEQTREPGALQVLPRQDTAVTIYQNPGVANADKLIQLAIEKNLDMDKLERLLAARKELIQDAAKDAFFDALSKFQSACPVVPKKKKATVTSRREGAASFTYKYAPLGDIVKAVAPLLDKFGLSYTIKLKHENNIQIATCTVHHVAGHSEATEFRAPIDTSAVVNDMQKAASAATFAKRQAFCNGLGVLTADEDDDGAGAGRQGGDTKGSAPKADGGLPPYPDAKFNKNLPEWKKLIAEGTKTADQIIATVGSKYKFSDSQLQKIRSASGVK